ncbi:phospholipase D family protein [Eubacterium sp. MSJ-33]|uniref:phospholipase D family protein n=1 Tax=Eubacterium sp. MSJ-33 TaxID=2841528 RepID=UPI001C773780|nr:phospholipase D family protein [Eubacterium sp. MSJ-33]QWT52775.1 phospholipase D family protein [Eubacterium sp. MSJ-33]
MEEKEMQQKRILNPETAQVEYCGLLQAGDEYELEQAVCLTYSLDLDALLGVLLSLGQREADGGQKEIYNPLVGVRIVRELSKKVHVFCNKGGCKLPVTTTDKTKALYQMIINNCVHEVSMKNEGYNFHPKVWILQYKKKETDKQIMKLVVSSRNLTFDQDMDVSVEITGQITDNNGQITDNKNVENRSLWMMLDWVARQIKQSDDNDSQLARQKKQSDDTDSQLARQKKQPDDTDSQLVKNLMENLKKIKFQVDPGIFTGPVFHWFHGGKKTEKPEKLFSYCENLIVVSPFLAEGVIKKFIFENGTKPQRRCLITRKESLTQGIYEIWCQDEKGEIWVTKDDCDRKIHAKIYYTEKDEKQKLYIGSLNATQNAFEHNEEVLLELKYKNQKYENIRKNLLALPAQGGKECSPFFEKVEDKSQIHENEERTESADDFRKVIYAIQDAKLSFSDGLYDITVEAEAENADLFKDIYIYPFGAVERKKAEAKFEFKEKKYEKDEKYEKYIYIACMKGLQPQELGTGFVVTKKEKDGSLSEERLIQLTVADGQLPDGQKTWRKDAEQACIDMIFGDAKYLDAWMIRDIFNVNLKIDSDGDGYAEGDGHGTGDGSVWEKYTWYEQLLKHAAMDPENLKMHLDAWMKKRDKYGTKFTERMNELTPLFQLIEKAIEDTSKKEE